MLPALAARLAGYASRDWCEPFVPTVARSYLGARVAILSQRPWQSGSLAFGGAGSRSFSYPCDCISTIRIIGQRSVVLAPVKTLGCLET